MWGGYMYSWESEKEFELVGLLLGVAIYNSIIVDLRMPGERKNGQPPFPVLPSSPCLSPSLHVC